MRTQIRARSLAKHSPKMSTLFRQLVTRAGKPPSAAAGREIYTFWVGNVLPTSPEERRKLLQTRSTKVRMVLLLRLMTETIEQLVKDEAEVMPPMPAAENVAVVCPAASQAGQSVRITHGGRQFDVLVPQGVRAGQQFQVRLPVGALPATGGLGSARDAEWWLST